MLAFIASLALVSSTPAATYYIDYVGGNDTNAGTSKTTPWKRAPGMAGFTGSHQPAAGDQFVFKGGVVWPLPIYLANRNGTEESPIMYRSDASWHAGASYSRPVLDMGGKLLSQGLSPHASHRGNVVWVKSSSHVTIADFEIRNYVWNDPVSTSNSDGFAVYYDTTTSCTVSNVFAHSWVVQTTTDSKFGGFGGYQNLGGTLINSVVQGPNVLTAAPTYVTDTGCALRGFCTSGTGVIGFPTIIGNEISGTTQGIWSGAVVRNNTVRDACDSYNASSHENGAWIQNNTEFSGNLLYNIRAGVGTYFFTGWGSRADQTLRVFNNIWWNTPQINLTNQQNPDESNELWFVNNVVHRASSTINATTGKSGAPFGVLVIQNNVFISDELNSSSPKSGPSGWPPKFISIADASKLGDHYTNSHNVYLGASEAAIHGIFFDRLYRPITDYSAVKGTGMNFSWMFDRDRLGETRPATGNWDIGAYLSGGSPTSTTPSASIIAVPEQVVAGQPVTLIWSSLNAASMAITGLGPVPVQGTAIVTPASTMIYTATATGGDGVTSGVAAVTVTVSDSPGSDIGQWLELEDGVVASPFSVANGAVSQSVQTDLANGGDLTYRFSIGEAGQYGILVVVDAPSEGSNSIFISIDNEPTDPESIWDIPVTTGFQQRIVSWRGAQGTFDAPQVEQTLFELAAGEHELIIRGRERNVRLDKLMIVERPSKPTVRPLSAVN